MLDLLNIRQSGTLIQGMTGRFGIGFLCCNELSRWDRNIGGIGALGLC
jgi:hypothetical protein